MISFNDIIKNEKVKIYLNTGNEALAAQGFTEHSFPHAHRVAKTAAYILQEIGGSERDLELAKIAGYLHDIGNLVNRAHHAQTGAIIAFHILSSLEMDPKEIALVISAIGSHDEETAFPVNPIAAALILADKSDVRRSRVQNNDIINFDIHDRVNYAVSESQVQINNDEKTVTLKIKIDTTISSVIDYFEIFLLRMILCRRAASSLNLKFELIINDTKL